MGADRNAGGGDGPDLGADPFAALQLHAVHAGLFHHSAGIGQGLLRGDLVTHKGHVQNHKGIPASPGHAAAIEDHLLQGYRQGVGIALHGHPQAVPHQDHVDARLVHQPGGGIVVAGELGDFFPPGFHGC